MRYRQARHAKPQAATRTAGEDRSRARTPCEVAVFADLNLVADSLHLLVPQNAQAREQLPQLPRLEDHASQSAPFVGTSQPPPSAAVAFWPAMMVTGRIRAA
jgi:hypothetical protein